MADHDAFKQACDALALAIKDKGKSFFRYSEVEHVRDATLDKTLIEKQTAVLDVFKSHKGSNGRPTNWDKKNVEKILDEMLKRFNDVWGLKPRQIPDWKVTNVRRIRNVLGTLAEAESKQTAWSFR